MESLNSKEAAKFLKMARKTLLRKSKNRQVPCHKPSKGYIYFKEELLEWVRNNIIEEKKCQSIDAVKRAYIIPISAARRAKGLEKVLEHPIKSKQKNMKRDL